ncbi:hypothetical protein D3C74_401190 [compost metagenome]
MISATVDQIVVSVGPYIFQSEPTLGSSSLATSGGRLSPPHNAFNRLLPAYPDSSSIFHVAGVACITVIPCVASSSPKTLPSAASRFVARTTSAPEISGRNSSRPKISNERVVTDKSLSSAVIPGFLAMESRKFVNARCGIFTPFGLPVEPEVKII